MKKLLITLILLAFTIPGQAATIYKWVDEKGVINFTDDYNKVPPPYRDRVIIEERKEIEEDKITIPPRETPQKKEEISTDIYGRDEAWWRDRVRPWKERLKEATENYERANKEYLEKSEELSKRRFGSRTQYKIDIIQLDKLNEEKKRYEAQMREVNEMLKRLSKEAEESKADPEWLK